MNDITWRLAGLGQLALLLEASAPKPGNVNRSVSFSDTSYRHFLASASMMSRGLALCATRGVNVGGGKIELSDVGLGELIGICTSDSLAGLNKKNTILGSILLYVPLTTAIAASLVDNQEFSPESVHQWIQRIISATTVEDSLGLYKAFAISSPGGHQIKQDSFWSDIHRKYDFENPKSVDNIIRDGIRLEDIFRISSTIDEISREWTEYFHTTLFEIYPYIVRVSHSLEDLEEGIVRTFVWLLSKRPDGLIIKKAGRERAEEVRKLADETIQRLSESKDDDTITTILDSVLREEGNLLNPGTTADFTSAAVFCRLASLTFQTS